MSRLTDVLLRKITPPAKGQTDIWDRSIPGFGIRVSAAGSRTFQMVYRHNGKFRRMSLGRYPAVSLKDARNRANAAISKISAGIDPKAEASSPAGAVFANVLDQFVERHCWLENRPRTAAETERILRSEFLPLWRDRSAGTITKSDVVAAIDAIVDRGTPSAARHAFAALRKMMNWCVQRGLIEASPCVNLSPPGQAKSRDRVLSDTELAKVLKAVDHVEYPFGKIVLLLLLTAQRRSEVGGMLWSEIDDKEALWTIPADRSKNGRPHVVPLSKEALKVLNSLPRFSSDLVFPARARTRSAYSGFSKHKRSLDALSEVHGWTLHDLRRTSATGMARLGVAPHVVERILNHTSGTFSGVAGIYNRFQYRDEMREAISIWSAHIAQIRRSAIKP